MSSLVYSTLARVMSTFVDSTLWGLSSSRMIISMVCRWKAISYPLEKIFLVFCTITFISVEYITCWGFDVHVGKFLLVYSCSYCCWTSFLFCFYHLFHNCSLCSSSCLFWYLIISMVCRWKAISYPLEKIFLVFCTITFISVEYITCWGFDVHVGKFLLVYSCSYCCWTSFLFCFYHLFHNCSLCSSSCLFWYL